MNLDINLINNVSIDGHVLIAGPLFSGKSMLMTKLVSIDEEVIKDWLTLLNIDDYSELDKHYYGYRTITYLNNEYLSLATISLTPIFIKIKLKI